MQAFLDELQRITGRGLKFNPYHDRRGRFATAPAFSGEPRAVQTQLTKAETGRIAEEVVARAMNAVPLNSERSNFPVDLVAPETGMVIEVKGGLVSNPRASQQWRATIGEPGRREKEWLSTASEAEKKLWNERKRRAIMDRKLAAVREVEQVAGKKLYPTTVGVIIDPDARKADVFALDGFHLRVGWNQPETREAYVGTFEY